MSQVPLKKPMMVTKTKVKSKAKTNAKTKLKSAFLLGQKVPAASTDSPYSSKEYTTVRSKLSSSKTKVEITPLATTQISPSDRRRLSPASNTSTVLSDYNRNRKRDGDEFNLINQIRDLLPVSATKIVLAREDSTTKLTAEQLEDQEAELRRANVEQKTTGWHRKVYRTSKDILESGPGNLGLPKYF